ncbi:DUF4238 domain-containing protein [Rhodobacter sp. NSM]|uniref:DUF4238 domain-containing protein n=1 Tax=Rhodobacter sp. NSM TaxID=3457501 RepID=UPI003FCFEC07
MSQITKRCHWVPQSYLRAFAADERREKIWRFSKTIGDPELKPIRKVAVKHYLYSPLKDGKRDDFLEKKLGSVENWFGSKVWSELCSGYLDLEYPSLRKMLSLMVATTFARNPVQFEGWKDTHRTIADTLLRSDSPPSAFIFKGKSHPVDKADYEKFVSSTEEEMKFAWNNYVSSAGDLAPTLLKMRMVVVASNRDAFVTSDNPVTIVHPSLKFRGVCDPETMVIFPISPRRLLVMDNRHNEPDGVYYQLVGDDPASWNVMIWRNAIDHMFSSRDMHAVLHEMVLSEEEFERDRKLLLTTGAT